MRRRIEDALYHSMARGTRRLVASPRAGRALATSAAAILAHALDPRERSRIGIGLYDVSYEPSYEREDLYDWEQRWFSRVLPAPPGRILVGAAGGGREVGALLERGYEVAAFEPADKPRAHGRARHRGRVTIEAADYDALTAAVRGETASPLADIARARYDAVLLGWGSFTHVAGGARRAALLSACDQLTDGPILASFYFREGAEAPDSRSDAARWGRRIGRVIGRARRVEGITEEWDFYHWGGFAHRLSVEDVESAARAAGRKVLWSLTDGFPHATFTKL